LNYFDCASGLLTLPKLTGDLIEHEIDAPPGSPSEKA